MPRPGLALPVRWWLAVAMACLAVPMSAGPATACQPIHGPAPWSDIHELPDGRLAALTEANVLGGWPEPAEVGYRVTSPGIPVVWQPGGDWLAFKTNDGHMPVGPTGSCLGPIHARLQAARWGEPPVDVPMPKGVGGQVAASKDALWVLQGDDEASAWRLAWGTWEATRVWTRAGPSITAFGATPGGGLLVYDERDGLALVQPADRSTSPPSDTTTMRLAAPEVRAFAVDADGGLLAAATQESRQGAAMLRIVDLRDGTVREHPLHGPAPGRHPTYSLAWGDAGLAVHIAGIADGNSTLQWTPDALRWAPRQVARLQGHAMGGLAVLGNGTVAVGMADGPRFVQVPAGDRALSIPGPGVMLAVALGALALTRRQR